MALNWRLLAIGATLAGAAAFFACGSDDKKDKDNTGTTTTLDFTKDINPILVKSCSGSTCHDKGDGQVVYVGNDANLKANKASVKSQLTAGAMPKSPSTISADDKSKIINYLAQ